MPFRHRFSGPGDPGMDRAALTAAVRHVRALAAGRGAEALTDGELLRAFTTRGDEAAFATLVRRHGPLVLGTCRRALRNAHDAEDAFQATFIILARRAAAIPRLESLAGWLHGV